MNMTNVIFISPEIVIFIKKSLLKNSSGLRNYIRCGTAEYKIYIEFSPVVKWRAAVVSFSLFHLRGFLKRVQSTLIASNIIEGVLHLQLPLVIRNVISALLRPSAILPEKDGERN
jgi:hypothetical protein